MAADSDLTDRVFLRVAEICVFVGRDNQATTALRDAKHGRCEAGIVEQCLPDWTDRARVRPQCLACDYVPTSAGNCNLCRQIASALSRARSESKWVCGRILVCGAPATARTGQNLCSGLKFPGIIVAGPRHSTPELWLVWIYEIPTYLPT